MKCPEAFNRVIGLQCQSTGLWVVLPSRVTRGKPVFSDEANASRYASTDALRFCISMRIDGFPVRMRSLYPKGPK